MKWKMAISFQVINHYLTAGLEHHVLLLVHRGDEEFLPAIIVQIKHLVSDDGAGLFF